MIPTADHDQGPPVLYSGPVGALATVRLDGHRWAMMPPGDPVADHLINPDWSERNAPR